MGYQDAIASIGIHTTADNKPSNGTVDGVDSFDTKTYAPVDPETAPYITKPDESAKYAGNVAGWSQSDAYGNNEYAYEVARNFLSQNTYGTNPFQPNDLNKTIQQQIAQRQGHMVGASIFELA